MAPIFKRGGQVKVGDLIDFNGVIWEVINQVGDIYACKIDGVISNQAYTFDNAVYYKTVN